MCQVNPLFIRSLMIVVYYSRADLIVPTPPRKAIQFSCSLILAKSYPSILIYPEISVSMRHYYGFSYVGGTYLTVRHTFLPALMNPSN